MNEFIGLGALVLLILVGSAVCSGVEAALLSGWWLAAQAGA